MIAILVICLIILLAVICHLKMAVDALLLYIKDMNIVPDKETVSKYSEKAAKKFFHIPS